MLRWCLASELRDRIRQSGVQIKVVDRQARKEYKVEPRQFGGRLLHQLPPAAIAAGEIYLELYLTEGGPDSRVGLYRAGTRVVAVAARVQKQFFEYAGPLFGVRVSPQSSVVPVGKSRTYRAVARDRSRHVVEHNISFHWDIVEGDGVLHNTAAEIVTFTAPPQPGLTRLRAVVTQAEKVREGDALITITDSLLPEMKQPTETQHGLPGYTFKKAPGKLWRSKYDLEQNVIVINNGHRDFVYASRFKSLQLRYICRLFAKEMVFKNFPGYAPEQLLERMIELSLYTEENLK